MSEKWTYKKKVTTREMSGKTFVGFMTHYNKKSANNIAEQYREGITKPKALARVIKDRKGYRVFIKTIPRK